MTDISDLIGIKFKDNGRSKEEGFDCYGLAIEIYRRNGIKLTDTNTATCNALEVHNEELKINIRQIDYIKELVLLEFIVKGTNKIHLGVALDSKNFIHATENQGVRISSLKSAGHFMTLSKIFEVE